MTQIDIEKTTDETLPPEKLNGMLLVAKGKDGYGGIEKILVPMVDCYLFIIDEEHFYAEVSFLTAFEEEGYATKCLHRFDNEGLCRSVLCSDVASCADCERLKDREEFSHPNWVTCGRLSYGIMKARLENNPDFVSFDPDLSLYMASYSYRDLQRYLDSFFFDDCFEADQRALVAQELRRLLQSERITKDQREDHLLPLYMRKEQIRSISLPDNGTKLFSLWRDHWKPRGRHKEKTFLREFSEYVNGATVNFKSGQYIVCNRFEALELINRLANGGWKPF